MGWLVALGLTCNVFLSARDCALVDLEKLVQVTTFEHGSASFCRPPYEDGKLVCYRLFQDGRPAAGPFEWRVL